LDSTEAKRAHCDACPLLLLLLLVLLLLLPCRMHAVWTWWIEAELR
jgi:hypothetical protein